MTRGAGRPRRFALAAILLIGCSAVVDPDDMSLPCVIRDDGYDPCPVGLFCIDNECVQPRCTSADERCNGEDDDCDGTIDEGHDIDADGFTWCGGGEMPLADCDDSQAAAHPADPARGVPAVSETCDGLDNDCNGMVDDGAICGAGKACIDRTCVNPTDCTLLGNECPAGEVCDTTREPPTCIPGSDCRVVGATCPSGHICDRATGNCVMPGGLGSPCSTTAECGDGYCALRGALGLPEGGRICAKACCSDADCPTGTICYAPGNGARLCVPGEAVGIQPGTGGTLASCGTGSDCASGFCEGGRCVGNCAAHGDCGGGSCTADVRSADSAVISYCRDGTNGASADEYCERGEHCRYGVCIIVAWGGGVCSGPCGTTSDCPGDAWYCGWEEAGGSRLQLCTLRGIGYGSEPAGARCGTNTDCRDVACVSGVCWDACCNDADCPGGACKAVTFGSGRYQMHCDPR